jgi:hypothetical protein
MGSSLDLDFVRREWGPDEASALRSMADSEGCYRIYKTGDENGWHGYKPINYPEEERDVLTSPNVRCAVLMYDRGKVVNVDGLWEKSPLVPRKKKGLFRRLFSSLFEESGKKVGESEVAKRETQTCNVCGQNKRSRIWGGCFSGHLICEDCLRRARTIPMIPGKELKCPICGEPLL